MSRPIKLPPRIFESFPEQVTCPVCHTNEDGQTVLIYIEGTQDGNIGEASPVHLVCAIPETMVRFADGGGALVRVCSPRK